MRFQVSGLSQEAAPVVSGRHDDDAAFAVFKGWRASAALQARFNPWVELEQARMLRDQIVIKFNLRHAGLMAGRPETPRAQQARDELTVSLLDRGWDTRHIENYFGKPAP